MRITPRLRKPVLSITSVLLLATSAHATPPIYMNPNESVEARIDNLLPKLSLDEKIHMLYGSPTQAVQTNAIAKFHIPGVRMTDGPLGSRWDNATAFPAGILMGSSFNPDLIGQVGAAIATEIKAQGRDMLLGPNININRVPVNGRSFEAYGEDPYLTSALVRDYVIGVQKQKVIATPKHFALNDQEYKRATVNIEADERTMNEIYFPPFQAAVDAGAWSVMAAYNKVNGLYCTENSELLNDTLKNKWGFQGFVVSDWTATHSTVDAANGGLDIEMPSGTYFSQLGDAVKSGKVAVSTIDDKVRRILRALFSLGIFDEKAKDRPAPSEIGSSEHAALALKVAQEGIVLLKNDNSVLPLTQAKKIAVIGPNAGILRRLGGGSAEALSNRHVSPLTALEERLQGTGAEVVYAPGPLSADDYPMLEDVNFKNLQSEFYPTSDLSGKSTYSEKPTRIDFNWDDSPDSSISGKAYSFRITGQIVMPLSGTYALTVSPGDDHFKILVGGEVVAQNLTSAGNAVAEVAVTANVPLTFELQFFHKTAGDGVNVRMGYLPPHPAPADALQYALATARASDAAIIYAGLSDQYETEGADRETMALPDGQDDLIAQVAAVNPNTIVVMNSGNPVLMTKWIDRVAALVQAWYPGQEGGYAIADVLLGRVNPSGKLAVSFPKRWEDASAYHSYPTNNRFSNIKYTEGIYVGYRHFDTNNVEPLFPFGYGLSYTRFSYSGLNVTAKNASLTGTDVGVDFTVANLGRITGAEAAQVYVHPVMPNVDRPFQELKGFAKPSIRSGETANVHIDLDRHAFEYYDVATHAWKVAPGDYTIRVGSSSRDPHMLEQTIHLQ